jgi:hypothetical protein
MEPTSDNGACTHPRAREISLLVAWKAPAEVLGNEAIFVAGEAQLSAFEAACGVSRSCPNPWGPRIAPTRPWRRSAI